MKTDKKWLMAHVDLKRPMWRPEHLKSFIRRIAGMGYNTLYFEFEDKLKLERHPDISHPEAMSHEEAREVQTLCHELGMDIMPLVQSLGHAEFVVAKDAYAHLRESPDVTDQYDPFSDDARKLIIDIYEEAIECFRPETFLNVGGDEARALGRSPRGREFVSKYGYGKLYLHHMLPLMEYLHNRGLRPVIASDMLLDYVDIIDEIPRYTVVMSWDYLLTGERRKEVLIWNASHGGNMMLTYDEFLKWDGGKKKEALAPFCLDEQSARDHTFPAFYYTDFLKARGLDVLTVCATRCYGDSPGTPHHNRHIPNCYYNARKGRECLGTTVTSWAVRRNHPQLGWPAFHAAAKGFHDDTDMSKEELTREYFINSGYPEYADAFKDFFSPDREPDPILSEKNLIVFMGPDKLNTDDVEAVKAAIVSQTDNNVEAALKDLTLQKDQYTKLLDRIGKDIDTTNPSEIDYWREGIRLMLLYIDVLTAVLDNTLTEQRASLKACITELSPISDSLFTKTYLTAGKNEEVAIRLNLIKRILEKTETPPC